MTARPAVLLDATSMPRRRRGGANYIYHLSRELSRLPDGPRLVVAARRETELDVDTAAGHRVVRIALPTRPLRIAWEHLRLPVLAGTQRVDVLHSPVDTAPLAPVPARRVLTLHDVTFLRMPGRYGRARAAYYRFVAPRAARRADLVITVSETAKRDIVALVGLAEERVVVVHNGVAPHLGIPAADEVEAVRARLRLERRYLCNMATIEPGKNLPTLLRAFGELVRRGHDLDLVLAGGAGWGNGGVEALGGQLGIAGRVRWPGYVPDELVSPLLGGAACFVNPALYEGFGLPPLEAMACGAPVVASDTGAHPEVLGDAALLVPPTDVRAIADAVERVLVDPVLAATLRERGLRRAAAFTWRVAAERTAEVYERALARQAVRR